MVAQQHPPSCDREPNWIVTGPNAMALVQAMPASGIIRPSLPNMWPNRQTPDHRVLAPR